MIDNSKQFNTFDEQLAYHQGWMDGMKNAQLIREEVDKEYKEKGKRGKK